MEWKGPESEKTLPTQRKIVKNDTFLRARIAVKKQGNFCRKGGVCALTDNKIAER